MSLLLGQLGCSVTLASVQTVWRRTGKQEAGLEAIPLEITIFLIYPDLMNKQFTLFSNL